MDHLLSHSILKYQMLLPSNSASSVSPTISPSPQTPQVQSQVRKKIQIPNYYVPPKVNIAPSISITESSDATNTTETIARPSLIRKSLVRLSNHP